VQEEYIYYINRNLKLAWESKRHRQGLAVVLLRRRLQAAPRPAAAAGLGPPRHCMGAQLVVVLRRRRNPA